MRLSCLRDRRLSVWLAMGAVVSLAGHAAAGTLPATVAARAAAADLIVASVDDWISLVPYATGGGDGGTVRVSSAASAEAVYLLFATNGGEASSAPHDRDDIVRSGTLILKRSRESGELMQAKLFLRDQIGSFARVFPRGERSVVDLYLFGERLYGAVPLPVPLAQLATMPLSRLMELTERTIDWPLVMHDEQRPADRRVVELIEAVRPQLPHLTDADDGAMDAGGNYVFIETGELQPLAERGFNCSGFCKWVIDGYYHPIEGAFTDIAELKRKDLELRGNRWSTWYEALRDPFFGLDWARNLAATLDRARTGRDVDPEAGDMREVDFATYVEDIGYPLESIDLTLYTLTVRKPGRFYVGSINREFGSAPVLRQHSHLAVFFPYIDAAGAFRVVQVDRNLERTTASLIRRYPGAYIHLTAIDAHGEFDHGLVAAQGAPSLGR